MKAKRVPTSPPVDLSEWIYNCGELDNAIGKVVTEAVTNTLTETPPIVRLPYYWVDSGTDGVLGPPVKDPLQIRIELELFGADLDGPEWEFSLSELILDEFNAEIEEGGDPEAAARLSKISARLREIADEIDSKLTATAN